MWWPDEGCISIFSWMLSPEDILGGLRFVLFSFGVRKLERKGERRFAG